MIATNNQKNFRVGKNWLFVGDEGVLYHVASNYKGESRLFRKAIEYSVTDGEVRAKYYLHVPMKVVKLLSPIVKELYMYDKR